MAWFLIDARLARACCRASSVGRVGYFSFAAKEPPQCSVIGLPLDSTALFKKSIPEVRDGFREHLTLLRFRSQED